MSEREYWLGFSVFQGIGPKRFRTLLERFGTAKNAWGAPAADIKSSIGNKFGEDFDKFRNKFSIPGYIKVLNNKSVWYMHSEDKNYPKLLLEIDSPPIVLYVRGEYDFGPGEGNFAIVGARRVTNYGQEVTTTFTQDLVAAGFVIVSGLAMGVDSVAHKATIDSGGKTIAVLGCGVDCCTPPSNISLYNSIVASGGCIVSEFAIGQPPLRGSFPRRNRIIAGLSIAALVTEGAEDSGALITADYATKFGRKVFAIPGPITSGMSKGPYKLIKMGGKLVTSAEDILAELQISNIKSQISNKSQIAKFKTDSREEGMILELLENEGLGFDEISRKTKIDASRLAGILSMMEIKGFIKNSSDGRYSRD